MITLYQFPRMLGIPNSSPFCLKLETWLKLSGLTYVVKELGDPRRAPKGKLPYIDDEGTVIADSRLIIEYLSSKYSVTLDDHLSTVDRAVAHSFSVMLEEHYYWAVLYNRWVGENWTRVRAQFFSSLPPLVRNVVPLMVQRQINEAIQGQGLGRHTPDEIYGMANHDIQAVSDFLGDKPYLMGDKACSADATLFAMLCNVLEPQLRSPLRTYAERLPNLRNHTRRIGLLCFPDYFDFDDKGD